LLLQDAIKMLQNATKCSIFTARFWFGSCFAIKCI